MELHLHNVIVMLVIIYELMAEHVFWIHARIMDAVIPAEWAKLKLELHFHNVVAMLAIIYELMAKHVLMLMNA